MAAVTVRNLPEDVHRALKDRATRNNRSPEAEMRAILEAAVRPEGAPKDEPGLGTLLQQISEQHGITNADVEALQAVIEENRKRDWRTPEPISFD